MLQLQVVQVTFVTAFNQLHNVYPPPITGLSQHEPARFLFRKQQKDTARAASDLGKIMLHHVEMLNHDTLVLHARGHLMQPLPIRLAAQSFSLTGDDQGPLRAEIAVLPSISFRAFLAQEYPSFDQIMENCRDLQDKLHGAMDLAAAIHHPFYEFEQVGSFMSFPARCLILFRSSSLAQKEHNSPCLARSYVAYGGTFLYFPIFSFLSLLFRCK